MYWKRSMPTGGLVIVFCMIAFLASASDEFGIYFDTEAVSSCELATPYLPLNAYLIYTQPTVAEIVGYELGIQVIGAGSLYDAQILCGGELDELAQITVNCATPIVCTPTTVLVTFKVLFGGPLAHFLVNSANDPTHPIDGPFVILPGGAVMEVTSEGFATLDGGAEFCGGLAASDLSWSSVKALYR